MERDRDGLLGVCSAAGAFAIWGLSPLYWKLLGSVPAVQLAVHRVVWSAILLVPLFVSPRFRTEVAAAFRRPRVLLVLCTTATLVALNWLTYIWAVNHDLLMEASLGYYINPLVNVVLGMIFLGERLRRAQKVAVGFAVLGVGLMTWHHGSVPLIALALAFTFGFYALLRKRVSTGSIAGLAVETLLLSVVGLPYLIVGYIDGSGALFRTGILTDVLLVCAGPLTAVPLILFTMGARRLSLAGVGLMQYIAPSLMFVLAVFVFGEPCAPVKLVTFVLIWIGLAIYSVDSIRARNTPKTR